MAALIVIPIAIIMLGTVSATLLPAGSALRDTLSLLGSPAVALMIALLLAFYFGAAPRLEPAARQRRDGRRAADRRSGDPVTGAGGVFGKVLVESGVGKALAEVLTAIGLPLVPAAFIISLALRASQGPPPWLS